MEIKCCIENCNRLGVHKINYNDAKVFSRTGIKFTPVNAKPPRRMGYVYLCEEHYKLWKKLSKNERFIREFVSKG
ncbi:MAG: hypothetical protein QXP02_00415 [Desulfurococcaceae archaeon]